MSDHTKEERAHIAQVVAATLKAFTDAAQREQVCYTCAIEHLMGSLAVDLICKANKCKVEAITPTMAEDFCVEFFETIGTLVTAVQQGEVLVERYAASKPSGLH